jgi:hypothetical protein
MRSADAISLVLSVKLVGSWLLFHNGIPLESLASAKITSLPAPIVKFDGMLVEKVPSPRVVKVAECARYPLDITDPAKTYA